jgi:hypothetical protein
MRLNGWQRIGIVASVVWVFVGGFWGNQIGFSQGDYVREAYRQCLAARSIQPDGSVPRDTDWKPCISSRRREGLAGGGQGRMPARDHTLRCRMPRGLHP